MTMSIVYFQLPGGVDMTLSELQDMAARQQQQIESQQQILVAKEQRLKYLKQQEQKQQHLASENDRLRKLRDKVEAQEMKLKKLQALRGQVEQHKANNGNLSKFAYISKCFCISFGILENIVINAQTVKDAKVVQILTVKTMTSQNLSDLFMGNCKQ